MSIARRAQPCAVSRTPTFPGNPGEHLPVSLMPSSLAAHRGAPKGTRPIRRAPVGSCVLSPAPPKPADPQLCGALDPLTPESSPRFPPWMTPPRPPPPHPPRLRASQTVRLVGAADFPEALSRHPETAAPGSWPRTRVHWAPLLRRPPGQAESQPLCSGPEALWGQDGASVLCWGRNTRWLCSGLTPGPLSADW